MLEEIIDAVGLHQPADEIEIRLAVLHAIFERRRRAGGLVTKIGEAAVGEDLLDDVDRRLLREDLAVRGPREQPEPGPQHELVDIEILPGSGPARFGHHPMEIALLAVLGLERDRSSRGRAWRRNRDRPESLTASTRMSNSSLSPSIALKLASASTFGPSGVVSLPCRWSWERGSAIASSSARVYAARDHSGIPQRVDRHCKSRPELLQARLWSAERGCGCLRLRPSEQGGFLWRDDFGQNIGAGEGNRTLVFSLEGCCSTIELHPRRAAPPG